MRPRFAVLTGTLLGVLFLGGAARAEHVKVTIDNFSFTPAQITIKPGDDVTWVNQDDIPHTVTDAATPRDFKSQPLDTGDQFSHVFAQAGTYHYFCSLHNHMQGTVVVQ